MKNSIKIIVGIIVLSTALVWTTTKSSPSPDAGILLPYNKTMLPLDAAQTCTVTADTFNSWFKSGKATQNGLAMPANSTVFPLANITNCDFYRWSQHMFLWAFSPASGMYGKGNIVLESPIFYDVSPEDSTFQRKLVPHTLADTLNMTNHLVKNGPNRLPVGRDKFGKLYEVEMYKIENADKPLVNDVLGIQKEVARITKNANGMHTFFDRSGQVIEHPVAVIKHRSNRNRIVQEIISGTEHAFLDLNGKEIDLEVGQATGDVLMAQNGSMVYYLTMVNDVYAYFLTASKTSKMIGSNFPTTLADRDSICAFARANHKLLPDSNALALEIKTSWVEIKNLPNPQDYIIVNALIPVYNKSDPKQWLPIGKQFSRMALIGVHIVGSVAGHPEMVWSTFEHRSNAPNAAYTYVDIHNHTKSVQQETGKNWLLFKPKSAADTLYNVPHMRSTPITPPGGNFVLSSYTDTINATPFKYMGKADTIISASNTQRAMPWGSTTGVAPNQIDTSSAASNSEVISINNTLQKLFVGNDVRKNYLFMGATWTLDGVAPNGNSYDVDSVNGTVAGVAIGTNLLANSTMETYIQSNTTTCFLCHSASQTNFPDSLSHVFSATQPLSVKFGLKKKTY